MEMSLLTPFLYFNTINPIKIKEITEIFSTKNCEIRFLRYPIVEILSNNVEELILIKAADAYKKCRVPIIVEHGALCIDYFNGFPGALSKPMWDLMGDTICKLIPKGQTRTAKAVSAVCYCDGKRRITQIGETNGTIALNGMGDNGFQWDPIFIPENHSKTFGQMEQSEKLKFSQAAKAYNKLFESFEFK
jgi:XTP/dITP diphosphohydrolase